MDVLFPRELCLFCLLVPMFLVYLRLANREPGDMSLIRYTYSGTVNGVVVESSDGKLVDAYLGIPYAAPPTGELRFKPPEDVQAWDDVFQANSKMASCFQMEDDEAKRSDEIWWVSNAPESEDCLRLNVWVPRPRPSNAAVLVWIHGGSFAHGSMTVDNYDGKHLAAEEGLIVVTINYRLSVFGFLYLDHEDAPGNVGLMDQAKALSWVQTNIRAFGGDPNRVTLFGHSTGSLSAQIHFTVPNNRGLFKHLILTGGSIREGALLTRSTALRLSRIISNAIGCSFDLNDKGKLITCLREKPPEEMILKGLDQLSLMPVLDGVYLSEDLETSFQELVPSDRSIMIGNTREEGVTNMLMHFPDRDTTDTSFFSVEDFKQLVNKTLGYPPEAILKIVMYQYTNLEDPQDKESLRANMVQFSTDYAFVCDSVDLLDTMTSRRHVAYQVLFSHRQESSIWFPSWTGVLHGEEIQFIFGTPLDQRNGFNTEEALLSRRTMRYFANFVKFGEPNSDEDALDFALPRWPEYSSGGKAYLHLGLQPAVERALSHTGCALRRALPGLIEALKQDTLEHIGKHNVGVADHNE